MSISADSSMSKKLEHKTYLGTDEKTFQYDDNLPSLPVPPLHQTMERYLRSVQPHVTPEEYETTRDVVAKFETGIGRELHEKLLSHAAEKRNWLEDWWLHHAYLTYREPLLPTMNTAGPHPLNSTLWKPSVEKAPIYGSLYLYGFLDFNLALREQRIKPHKSKDGTKMSMDQFRYVFNCSRIPGQDADSLSFRWKTNEEGECPLHMAVLCNGHIWTMYPWDHEGKPLRPPELEVQIRYIREQSDTLGTGPSLAALTCDKRDSWAKNRDWLKSLSLTNMKNLDLVESAMFVFVLDNSEPMDEKEMLWEGLCGDTSNRWADKSLSAIMTRNGYGVMNNDHTPYDAMVSVIIGHYQHLLLLDMNGEWTGSREIRSFPMPTRLHFDLDYKLFAAIDNARDIGETYTKKTSVVPFTFSEYGRDSLRPHKLHPDSYIQMALQLTYTRLHGRLAPTYETATTRQFHHGRTETIRSASVESVEFVQAMLNHKAKNSEKHRKLVAAMNSHNEQMTECQKCQGVDRHLFGLLITALESGSEIPEIFTNSAYAKSGGGGNYVLSTSTVGYTPVYGGVSAMVHDGYGVFYTMLPSSFRFFVTSFHTSTETNGEDFISALNTSMRDMYTVISLPQSNL
ncbi:hypothetical protein Pmani_000173 [Petrolisthes manimaculis]|uniref:Choline/carnitine acyltransferase domain-containing protein n=1 Tax=Petrolisthes manimaculis TaxID=1843537 RepID=A0AAE1QMH8_9EUCA|nr:hypothetical protein Pmani_000173 [Petrolisthes manimaculis]